MRDNNDSHKPSMEKLVMEKREPRHTMSRSSTQTTLADLMKIIDSLGEAYIGFDKLIERNQLKSLEKPRSTKAITKGEDGVLVYKKVVHPKIIIGLIGIPKIYYFLEREAHKFYGSHPNTKKQGIDILDDFIPESPDALKVNERMPKRSAWEDYKYTKRSNAEDLMYAVMDAYVLGHRVYLLDELEDDLKSGDVDEVIKSICLTLIGKARTKSNINSIASHTINRNNRDQGIHKPPKGGDIKNKPPTVTEGDDEEDEDEDDDYCDGEGDNSSSGLGQSGYDGIITPDNYWRHIDMTTLSPLIISAIDAIAKIGGFGKKYSEKAVIVYVLANDSRLTLDDLVAKTGASSDFCHHIRQGDKYIYPIIEKHSYLPEVKALLRACNRVSHSKFE